MHFYFYFQSTTGSMASQHQRDMAGGAGARGPQGNPDKTPPATENRPD